MMEIQNQFEQYAPDKSGVRQLQQAPVPTTVMAPKDRTWSCIVTKQQTLWL